MYIIWATYIIPHATVTGMFIVWATSDTSNFMHTDVVANQTVSIYHCMDEQRHIKLGMVTTIPAILDWPF